MELHDVLKSHAIDALRPFVGRVDDGTTTLLRAADADVVRLLLEHGANEHACRDFELVVAAARGDMLSVRDLLAQGADARAWNQAAIERAEERGHVGTGL